ncbi:MAG: hypothetical protein KY468_16555 [Armatimonadetes bacterium]|nr:hypothetical protein [Armatimonadota bacterium]
MEFVNARSVEAAQPEIRRAVDEIFNQGDDFITVALPRLAATATPGTEGLIAAAVRQYEEEKAVVDARLFQKIDLAMKGGDLKELMELLIQKTGVRFYVQDDLKNWKLTVFMKEQPARDLMRQVARLFNLEWRRRGREGKYTYQLVQTLKQRLEEEELRRRDENRMLLSLMDAVEPYLEHKDTSQEELIQLREEALQRMQAAGSKEEKNREWEKYLVYQRFTASRGEQAFFRLFSRLSPAQLLALKNGYEVVYRFKGDGSEDDIPRDIVEQWHREIGVNPSGILGGVGQKPLEALEIKAHFGLNRRMSNAVGLHILWESRVKGAIGWLGHAAMPVQMVTATPFPATSHPTPDGTPSPKLFPDPDVKLTLTPKSSNIPQRDSPNRPADTLDSADFLEDLHRKSRRSVIADYYTRVYPRSSLTFQDRPLSEILNDAARQLKSDWTRDSTFLRLRRFDQYNERQYDIPNHLLKQWRRSKLTTGHLSLDDLAEISALPDSIWKNELWDALRDKYSIDEEGGLARRGLKGLRLYAALTPEQRQLARSDSGLSLATITRDQMLYGLGLLADDSQKDNVWFYDNRMKEWIFNPYGSWREQSNEVGIAPDRLGQNRFYIRFREPGYFMWHDWVDDNPPPFPVGTDVRETTREKAETAVEAYLKGKGQDQQRIDSEKANIGGPELGVLSRLEIGRTVILEAMGLRDGRGMSFTPHP